MSRSNGSGGPPNGWPNDYPPLDGQGYNDPYYAPQAVPPSQRPQQHGSPAGQQPGQPTAAARAPRIQGAPSRVPQAGIPATGLPPTQFPQGHNPSQDRQPPQGYAQPYPPAGSATARPSYPAPGQQPAYAPAPSPPQPSVPGYAQPRYAQPPQGYANPQGYPAPSYAQQPDPRYPAQPGYDRPSFEAGQPSPQQPTTQRPTAPPQGYPAQSYMPAPQTQAYVPETTGRPTHQPVQQVQPQAPQQRAPSPYDGWAQPGPQPAAPSPDPRSFDLGHYMPAPEPRTGRPTAPAAWTPEPMLDPRSGSMPHGAGAAAFGDAHGASGNALEPVYDESEYDDEQYEDDEPRKTRYGLIAASIIGAIIAGGGLSYAYTAFVAPKTVTAAAPVVKSSGGPVKIKPVDPGGTKFANADSKMMDRIDSLSGSSGSGSTADTDGGPRQVKTMTIERETTSPPAAVAVSASQPVPGMIISGLPPPRPAAPVVPAAPPALPPAASPPPPQQVASVTTPAPIKPAGQPGSQAAAQAAKKPVVAPPSRVGGPKGANGFVAVLASVPASETSRTQAMQQYADLQQRFGSVLASKAPDVVDATVKNTPYHRLVVGPPASREAASGLCAQLKAAGYTSDCWVTAF